MKNNFPLNNPAPFSSGLNNFFNLTQTADAFSKMTDKALKDIFKGEIRGSFLIEIKAKVNQNIAPYFFKLFSVGISEERIATGALGEPVDFEISKTIIGIHHANTIFLTPEEISGLTKSQEYKEKLIKQATYHVFLRQNSAAFFRHQTIMNGERFNYYPVPYLVLAMCTRMNELFRTHGGINESSALISIITNKAIAALSLLEDGFFDSAYMPCRTIIEMYVKLLLLRINPAVFPVADKFAYYDLEKTNCSKEYTDEFNERFAERKNKSCRNKVEYMHFGFVDEVEDYHEIVQSNPYSTIGIFAYLKASLDEDACYVLDILENLYKACHGFIHGNVVRSKYQVLHYFEISLILGLIIPSIYKMTCDESGTDQELYKEMMEYLQNDFEVLMKQYASRTTESLTLEQGKYIYYNLSRR